MKVTKTDILTLVASAGVIFTIYESIKDTCKYKNIKKEEFNIKKALPSYIPTIISGAATVCTICSIDLLSRKQQAKLLSSYLMLEQSYNRLLKQKSKYDDYRKNLAEDKEVDEYLLRSMCNYHASGIEGPDREYIFIDSLTGNAIKAYEREILDAEYHINRQMILKNEVKLNEFYELVGFPTNDYGNQVYWAINDSYCWIDFTHDQSEDNPDEVYINYLFPPQHLNEILD